MDEIAAQGARKQQVEAIRRAAISEAKGSGIPLKLALGQSGRAHRAGLLTGEAVGAEVNNAAIRNHENTGFILNPSAPTGVAKDIVTGEATIHGARNVTRAATEERLAAAVHSAHVEDHACTCRAAIRSIF